MLRKLFSLLLLLICLLLSGCSKETLYFDSPEEAYQEGFEQPYNVRSVIDCIEVDEHHVFWLAVIDTPDQPRILEAVTEVKDGKYRLIDRHHFTPLNSASANTISGEFISWQTEPLDENDEKRLVWIWVDTDSLTTEEREQYTCKDYTILSGEDTVQATLVYYILEAE